MSRRFIGRGVVGLEAEEAAAAAADDAVVVEGAEADSVEAAISEVIESDAAPEADAKEEDGATAEAEETVEALEALADVLRVAAKNGGLDKNAAAILNIATEHLYSRVGLKAQAAPALESFGGTSTRIGSTQLALEGLVEEMKKIWAAIVSAFKRLGAWMADHWNKVFGGAEKLQKRAQSMLKAADAAGTKKIKEKTFEDASLVKALCIGSDIPTDVAAALAKCKEVAKRILIDTASERVAGFDNVVASFENTETAKKVTIEPFTGGAAPSAEQAKALGVAGEGMEWHVSPELPGGQAMVLRTPSTTLTGADALNAYAKYRVAIQAVPGGKAPTKVDVKTLELNQIEAIAKTVDDIGAVVQDFRKIEEKLSTLLKKATAAAEKAGKSAGDSAESDAEKADRDVAKAIRSAASNLPKVLVGGFTSVSTYSLRVGNAALNLCEKSLKQYE